MEMAAFGTHQSLLTAALAATNGPILEMGGGWYSTPLVSAFANTQRRRAFTLETSDWVLDKLSFFQTDCHSLHLVPGFRFDQIGKYVGTFEEPPPLKIAQQEKFLNELLGHESERFSVVFIDQAPGFLRAPAIRYFAERADFIITHDSEHVEHYRLEPTLSQFASRWDFTLHRPNAVILSNVADCGRFEFLGGSGMPSPVPKKPAS